MAVIFAFLAPLVILLLIGVGIAALLRRRLTFANLVHVYMAVVTGVCVVLALVGGALLLKAIFSAAFGTDFSYVEVSPGPAPELRTAVSQARDDIALGATLLVIGLGSGVAHEFGKAAARRRNPDDASIVERGFDLVMLGVATVVGLVSSAALLNDLLRRYVVTDSARNGFDLPHPGEALAYTLMFVPLWILFAIRVWRALLGSRPRRSAIANTSALADHSVSP